MDRGSVAHIVEDLFARAGAEPYAGESIAPRAHALQSAFLATDAGAKPPLVVAALLHDVGRLLVRVSPPGPLDGRHHDAIGCAWLALYFGKAVVDPVRLRVEAKRYLCAVDPDYMDALSPASLRRLDAQGGPMTDHEADAFERMEFARDAVRLRRWDDRARTPHLQVPGLESYAPLLIDLSRPAAAGPVAARR